MKLFGRSYRLILGDLEIAGGETVQGDGQVKKFGLDIAFKIEKTTLAAPPNKATIQVVNLNADHRYELEAKYGSEIEKSKRKPLRVELMAGYGDDIGVIFRGDLRNLKNKHEGTEWITEVSGADAGHAFKISRVSRSFAPGTDVYTVARACVDALGIGRGNLAQFADQFNQGRLGKTFAEGCVLFGSAEQEFDHIARASGFDWSVQFGVLQLTKRGQPVQTKVYELAPDSGLVDSPFAEVDATVIPGKADSKEAAKRAGLVNVKSLLIHDLAPGFKVALKSDHYHGGFQIVDLVHQGNMATDDWHNAYKVKAY
jgi:hypothetical protein